MLKPASPICENTVYLNKKWLTFSNGPSKIEPGPKARESHSAGPAAGAICA